MCQSVAHKLRHAISVVAAALLIAPTAQAVVSLVATTDTLPLAVVVGTSYSGRFSCFNDGTEAIANANCTVSGLPAWATVGACSPPVPVASLPAPPSGLIRIVGSITCPVTGTPTSSGMFSIAVNGSGTGVSSTAQANLRVFAVPTELIASINLNPGVVGQSYSGAFTCDSAGTTAPINRTCSATGLPAWATYQCFPPADSFLLCIVRGVPTATGTSIVTVTTTASNASSATATGTLVVSASAAAAISVPALNVYALFPLSLLLLVVGRRTAARKQG